MLYQGRALRRGHLVSRMIAERDQMSQSTQEEEL